MPLLKDNCIVKEHVFQSSEFPLTKMSARCYLDYVEIAGVGYFSYKEIADLASALDSLCQQNET